MVRTDGVRTPAQLRISGGDRRGNRGLGMGHEVPVVARDLWCAALTVKRFRSVDGGRNVRAGIDIDTPICSTAFSSMRRPGATSDGKLVQFQPYHYNLGPSGPSGWRLLLGKADRVDAFRSAGCSFLSANFETLETKTKAPWNLTTICNDGWRVEPTVRQ